MEIKQLENFIIVVEEGSINKASKKILIAQPALSRQIKLLEEELNVTLFIRNQNKLVLTNAGNELYNKALYLKSLFDKTKNDIKNVSHTLHLGMISSSISFILNKIENFTKTNTNIKLEINEANTYQLLESLDHHIIDFAICRTPFKINKYDYKILLEEPMILLSNNKLPSNVDISFLNNKPLLIYRRFEEIFTNIFEKNNLTLSIKAVFDDAKTTILFASKNLGYAVVPKSSYDAFTNLDLNYSIILNNDLNTKLVFISRKDEVLSNEIKNFIKNYM